MKKLTILLTIIIASTFAFSQNKQSETIYLSNGSIIKGNVIELTQENIKIQTSDGSIYVYELAQVERIVKNDIETNNPENNVATESHEISNSPRPFIKGARFNGYLDINLLLGGIRVYDDPLSFDYRKYIAIGQSPNFSLGVRIFDYGYIGFLSGIEFMEFFDYDGKCEGYLWMIPFMVDARGYYPINEKLHPYIQFAWGGGAVFADKKYYGTNWKFRLGAGIDIKRLSLGIGWSNMGLCNQFFIKVGAKIGKCK